MKLELRVSGGIGSPLLSRKYELDLALQPDEIQQKLDALIQELLLIPPVAVNPRLRDAMSYELTITSEHERHTVAAESGSVPAPMRALVNLVKSLAVK